MKLLQASESGHDESILKLKTRLAHLENSKTSTHSPSPASFERVQRDLEYEQRLAYLEDRLAQLGEGRVVETRGERRPEQWENTVRSFQR